MKTNEGGRTPLVDHTQELGLGAGYISIPIDTSPYLAAQTPVKKPQSFSEVLAAGTQPTIASKLAPPRHARAAQVDPTIVVVIIGAFVVIGVGLLVGM